MIHRVPYSAANFTTFEMVKRALDPHVDSDVVRRLAAGGAAGIVACTAVRALVSIHKLCDGMTALLFTACYSSPFSNYTAKDTRS
jgi:hypothetical protein